MSDLHAHNLASTYIRLRNDASIETLPVDDSFWQRLINGQLGTFHNEYLVTSLSFDADWDTWEMHPNGDEIVCLLSGKAEFILEVDGGKQSISLQETGSYLIVPQGVWHTAKIKTNATVLFITAGEDTQHRELES